MFDFVPHDFVVRGLFLVPSVDAGKHPWIIVVEDPDAPGIYMVPGGTPQNGETPIEAMKREWEEEVGDEPNTFQVERATVEGAQFVPQERQGRNFPLYPFVVTKRHRPLDLPKQRAFMLNPLPIYRERPYLVRADDLRIKPSHRLLLALVLPELKYPAPVLSEVEQTKLCELKSQLAPCRLLQAA